VQDITIKFLLSERKISVAAQIALKFI